MTERDFTRAHNDYLDPDRHLADDDDLSWEDYEEMEGLDLEDQLDLLLARADGELDD